LQSGHSRVRAPRMLPTTPSPLQVQQRCRPFNQTQTPRRL
jgi:hypothetical protein